MIGRVLIVDDNALNRMMLGKTVRDQGHDVEMAADGRSALQALREGDFDLVLLDVLMPEMDGYQVLEAIMADETLRHIPVIMVSALDEMDSVIRCIELGAQDYLPKPANPLLLRARMNASLARKNLRDIEVEYTKQIEREKKRADDLLNVVIPIGAVLSRERDVASLLDRMLLEAKVFCNAEAGTIYLRTDDDRLQVVTARFDSQIAARAGDAREVALADPPIPIADHGFGQKEPPRLISAVALSNKVVNIADAESETAYDLSDIHRIDRAIGYRSVSILALPLRGSDGRVIGVVQLINARDPRTGSIVPFDAHLEQMMSSFSVLAAVALENYQREQRLQQEIEILRIEIDEQREARQVAELTETEFFRQLETKTDMLRRRLGEAGGDGVAFDSKG